MRVMLLVLGVLLAQGVNALEKKSLVDVDLNVLTAESQQVVADNNSLDMVWWIIPEFWEVSFRQQQEVPGEQIDDMLAILNQYAVLAVVQADVSPFGAFRFADKETVMNGLKVEAIDAEGQVRALSHTEPSDPDLRLLLDQVRPILTQSIGNMGQNMYFFPVPLLDDDGERIVSPYEKSTVRVTLLRDGVPQNIDVEAPLDSLFIPRTCPNGKPAHVSWRYCPWSGKKLPK